MSIAIDPHSSHMGILWVYGLAGFIHLVLLVHTILANEHRFTFRTDLEEDQIQYGSVSIPRHSSRVYVKISADGALPTGMQPMVLLRYNGLPTLETNDASYDLKPSEAFELLDSAPSEATLFVGFWGGVLPNSYRHFAGKARVVSVTMDALVFTCETEALSGNDCSEELVSIGASRAGTETIMRMEEGIWIKRGMLMLPNGLDRVELNATLTERTTKDLCSAWQQAGRDNNNRNVRDKVSLTLRLYMNQPDEDRESGRMAAVMDMADSCSGNGVTKPLTAIVVKRPYSGTWRMSAEFTSIGRDGKPEKLPDEYARKSVVDVSVVARFSSCPSGFAGWGELVEVQGYELTSGVYMPWGSSERKDCQLPVTPLRSFRSSNRRGGLQLRSSDTRLTRVWQEEAGRSSPDPEGEVERVSLKRRVGSGAGAGAGAAGGSVMFSGSLEHLVSVVGGLVQIQLRVRPLGGPSWLTPRNMKRPLKGSAKGNDTLYRAIETQDRVEKELHSLTTPQIQRRLLDNHFLLSLRVGALASDATVPISGTTAHRAQGGSSVLDPLDSFSGDALVLSTRDATVRLLDDASAPTSSGPPRGKDQESGGGSQPLPSFLRPHMPTSREEEGGETRAGRNQPEVLVGLQYTWTLDKPSLSALTATSLHSLDSLYLRVTKVIPPFKQSLDGSSQFDNFVVNVGVNILHCHAESCVHGTCVVRENSDVPHSSCDCDYPYAGEKCDQMALSLPVHVAQVLLLVCSNFAALPGIIASTQQRLFMLAMCVFLAAASSSLYHLCDMGVVCVGGLSYSSYQVFDVLFCLLTVGVTCLHHSPLDAGPISALAILLLAAILPVVVNDATHPMTVIAAISLGAGLLVCTWLNYATRVAVRLSQRQRQKQRQRQGQWHNDGDAGDSGDLEMTTGRSTSSASGPLRLVEEETEALLSRPGRATPPPPPAPALAQSHAYGSDSAEAKRREEEREDNEALASAMALFAENKSVASKLRHLGRELRHSILAGAIALAGLGAFLTQTRENYAVTHSIWHVCVMGSTFYFVQGRVAVIRNLRGVVHYLQQPSSL